MGNLTGRFVEDLQILTLDNNALTHLPPSICSLQNLAHLSVSGNALQELPPCIGELKKLVELDVEDNELNTLPPSITQLKLKNLYIDHNHNLKRPSIPSLEFCDIE